MRKQLEALFEKKQKLFERLNLLRINILASIYKGTIKGKPIKQIHKDILKVIKLSGIKLNKYAVKYAFNITKKAKKIKETSPLLIAVAVYSLFQKEKCFKNIKSLTKNVITDFEANEKEKIINNYLEHNRELENPKIIYLASRHDDSAEDHRDYQGMYFYDENWKQYIKERTQEVQDFIDAFKMKSFQWVTHRPVWFITRPHCRHYFKAITIDEAMTSSISELLKKYDMSHEIGQERTRTIAHSTHKNWYTITNMESIIRQYEERLKYHQSLNSIQSTPDLIQAIDKDKFLIEKWKNFLTSQQK